jgi:hypothetical protein
MTERRRASWTVALLAVVAAACDDEPEEVPLVDPQLATSPTEEPPEMHACDVDTDCVVVAVRCVAPAVAHREDAAYVGADLSRNVPAGDCHPDGVPVEIVPFCGEHYCQGDRVLHPELRACETDTECVALEPGCSDFGAVRSDRRAEAEALVEAGGRSCPPEEGGMERALAEGETVARCIRGYCQRTLR